MAIEQITPGPAPLLWSNIHEAFDIINQNFTELNARTDDGSSGGVNFSNLFTDVSPANTNLYFLGQSNKTWKSLYLSEIVNAPGNQNNGLWLGSAQVSGQGGIINLPKNSTVGSELIINEENTSFKTFLINETEVVARSFTDTLTITSSSGLNIVADNQDNSLNFLNTGVLSLSGTSGQIGVSNATGNITLTNLGVLSLLNQNYSPTNPVVPPVLSFDNRAPGAGISVSNATGNTTITNTGILSIGSGGGGIFIDFDPTIGRAVISNSLPNVDQNVFTSIEISGQPTIEASLRNDILTFIEGYGIQLTNNPSQKSITIEFINDTTINGSVVGAGDTLLVDSVNNKILGPVFSNVTGNLTGSVISNDESTLLVNSDNNSINAPGGINGDVTGDVTGNVIGDVTGNLTGSVISNDGNTSLVDATTKSINAPGGINGDVIGNVDGDITGDVKGSIFGNDSSMLVNGLDGKIVGPIDTQTVTTEKLIKKTVEITGATGVFDHNCANGHIFIHSDIIGNFIPNLTNFSLDINEFTEVTFILIQGVQGRIINGFRINGDTPQLRWIGGVQPAGTANRREIIKFEILRRSESYSVYGELKSFASLT